MAATTKTGGAVKGVKVVTESAPQSIVAGAVGMTAYVDIQGMSLSMTVPSGEKALLLITFSSASVCLDGSGATNSCWVRVLVDNGTALPGQVIFDSAADGNALSAYEANSMQFVAGPLSAGSHTVKVQAYLDETFSSFQLDTRTLSVLRSKV